MLEALLYFLVSGGVALSAAGLLYGLSTPKRPRLIVGSIALALLAIGLWRLETGRLPISLPRHIIAVVDCKAGALDVAAGNLAALDDVGSASFVLFDSGSGCPTPVPGNSSYRGINLPLDPAAIRSYAGIANRADCGLDDAGSAALNRLNDIACGIELALDRRGLLFRTRTPAVVLFLETEDQLGVIPRGATNVEAGVRHTLGLLLDQDVPLSTQFVAESRSIGRSARLESRNDVASEIWAANTVFVMTLRDQALTGLDGTPDFSLQGTFRSLGGVNCDGVTDLTTTRYPSTEEWRGAFRDDLVRPGERDEEIQIIFRASHLISADFLVPRFRCDGWIRLELEATLSIEDEDVRFPIATTYFRQHAVPSGTLVEGSNSGRLSDDSWYGADGRAPTAIETLDVASASSFLSAFADLDNAPLVGPDCRFGIADLRSGARTSADLNTCLETTKAIILVEPSVDDLSWLGANTDFLGVVGGRGRALVVIGPPAQTAATPAWLHPAVDLSGNEQATLVQREQQVHFIPDRGLLARAETDGVKKQQDVVEAIAKRADLLTCGSNNPSAGVIDYTADHFGLLPTTLVNLTAPPAGNRLDMTGPDATATYSRFSTAPADFGSSPSIEPYLASHALVQLANFVVNHGGAEAWESTARPATTVVLFAAAVFQPDIDSINLPSVDAPRLRRLLTTFFASGAKVVVVELPTGFVNTGEIKRFLEGPSARSGTAGPYDSVSAFATSMGRGAQVVQESLDPTRLWAALSANAGSIQRTAFGRGFDSEMNCVSGNTATCGTGPSRPRALERHLVLAAPDRFDASSVATDDRDETVYTEHHYGRSRIHTFGYSPFARDFVERDALTTFLNDPAGSPVMLDRCFLDAGALNKPDRGVDPYVRNWVDGWGFTRLIDLVRHSGADLVTERDGQVVAVEEADNRQSVDIVVRARPGSTLPEPEVSAGYVAAPVDYDPVEELATYRINRDPSSPDPDESLPLTIRALDLTEQVAVKLLPLETSFQSFEIWRRVTEMSSGTGSLYSKQQATIGRYGVASLSILVLVFTLIVLSPLVRRWTGFFGALRRILQKQKSGELRTVAISGFSVEAVLSEWGANPGEAATGRHAGIPLGTRTALQDDSLASVIWADLAGLVAPDTFPFKKPRVRLRSLSQTKESVVIIDDSGSLKHPSPLWQSTGAYGYGGNVINIRTGKSEFAARLGAAVARGLRLTGSVKLVTSSSAVLADEVQPDADATVLTDTIRNRIQSSYAKFRIHREQFSDDETSRLTFLIADPLCTSVQNIEKLAERMAANGGELRLALVVSESDRNPASLMLDLSSSGFIDRTEWTRYELSVAMENRIEQLRTAVNAHGARIAVLDADMTSSEVLAVIRDKGLLD
ncbi:MAG: hypothetical protein ACFHX7_12370 [Pseudomonadota bacterium]